MNDEALTTGPSKLAPIFVVGVPRSGTTLLRMVLDSHPDVMCGPEAPWIAGRGGTPMPSFARLTSFLTENKWGAVSGFSGVDEETVNEAMGGAIDTILSKAAATQGAKRWAEKTPENVINAPFLHRLFPHARFVHVVRDGRDVALSTIRSQWKTIVLHASRVRNTYRNALRRWVEWTNQFEGDAAALNLSYRRVFYESLVRDPERELRQLLAFLRLPWRDDILRPHENPHDIIDERGEGVRSFLGRDGIDTQSINRWQQELTLFQRRITRRLAEPTLTQWGYAPTVARGNGDAHIATGSTDE